MEAASILAKPMAKFASFSTRERLLEAAERLLAAAGTHGTGIQQVRTEAGVSHGSLYHAFPGGKEELVTASIERSGVRMVQNLDVLFETRPLPEACEAAFIATAARLEDQHFERGCELGTPASDGHNIEAVRVVAARAFELLVDRITSAGRLAGMTDEVASALAVNIVSLYQGAILVAVTQRSREPMDAAARLARRIAEQSLPVDR